MRGGLEEKLRHSIFCLPIHQGLLFENRRLTLELETDGIVDHIAGGKGLLEVWFETYMLVQLVRLV